MDSTTTPVIHGFRSATSVIAFCGEVVRPDPEDPRTESTWGEVQRTLTMPNLCPGCREFARVMA